MYSLDQLKCHMTTVDRQLLFMLVEQQIETNRLLARLINENSGSDRKLADEDKTAQGGVEALKRPQLMQMMAKLQEKPKGWNTWETEEIRRHLKGVV